MKRIIPFVLVITLFSFQAPKASAIFCSNCSTIGLQIPELAKEIITAGATLATQINTYLLQYKTLVLDPLANAMITVTLLQQQKNTINLVTGSLGGNALIISNPEQWIKNKGLNAIRINIGDLSTQNGTYTNSILSTVINTYRTSSDLKNTLESLGQSSIPTMVQNNICKDASLTSIAKNDVAVDGYASPADVQRRKQELFNSLCVGNPTINIQLGKTLEQVASQRPDFVGLDGLLAMTSNDNAYARSVRANLLIAEQAAQKEKTAQNILDQGRGTAAPTKCTDTPTGASAEGPITIADVICRNEVLTNTSGAVSAAFDQAINAPIQKLINSFGDGILGTLSALLSVRNTVGLLQDAFSGADTSTEGGITQGEIDTVVTPIENLLDRQSESLDKLEAAHTNLLAEATRTENIGSEVRGCFQGLVSEFGISEQDSRVASALSYAERRRAKAEEIRNLVSTEAQKVEEARTLISETRINVASASSTQAVNDAFSSFNQRVQTNSLPGEREAALREADYITLKGENDQAVMQEGEAYNFKQSCSSIRASYMTYN